MKMDKLFWTYSMLYFFNIPPRSIVSKYIHCMSKKSYLPYKMGLTSWTYSTHVSTLTSYINIPNCKRNVNLRTYNDNNIIKKISKKKNILHMFSTLPCKNQL